MRPRLVRRGLTAWCCVAIRLATGCDGETSSSSSDHPTSPSAPSSVAVVVRAQPNGLVHVRADIRSGQGGYNLYVSPPTVPDAPDDGFDPQIRHVRVRASGEPLKTVARLGDD